MILYILYKPILSSYVSFGSRDVVWENRLTGRRIKIRESRSFGSSFTLNWTCNLSGKEMKQVLAREESESLLISLAITKKAYLGSNL
jgi:hypothetical protein